MRACIGPSSIDCRLPWRMLWHWEVSRTASLHCWSPCRCLCPVQVNIDVEVLLLRDMLKGDAQHELRVKLKEHRTEKYPFKDDD